MKAFVTGGTGFIGGALVDRLLYDGRDDLVVGASLFQGPSLGLGVAVHVEEQRHVGQPIGQDLDVAADQVGQPVDRGTRRRLGFGGAGHQRFQRPLEAEPEQLLLALDVVVDRRLRESRRVREVLEAGAVVAALGEDADRDVEEAFQVVGGAHLA